MIQLPKLPILFQQIRNSAKAVAASGQWDDVTANPVALQPGLYQFSGFAGWGLSTASGQTVSILALGIGTTSGNNAPNLANIEYPVIKTPTLPDATYSQVIMVPTVTILVQVAASYYLKYLSIWSGGSGTMSVDGMIQALQLDAY